MELVGANNGRRRYQGRSGIDPEPDEQYQDWNADERGIQPAFQHREQLTLGSFVMSPSRELGVDAPVKVMRRLSGWGKGNLCGSPSGTDSTEAPLPVAICG